MSDIDVHGAALNILKWVEQNPLDDWSSQPRNNGHIQYKGIAANSVALTVTVAPTEYDRVYHPAVKVEFSLLDPVADMVGIERPVFILTDVSGDFDTYAALIAQQAVDHCGGAELVGFATSMTEAVA